MESATSGRYQRQLKIRLQQQAIREAARALDLSRHPELAQNAAAWQRQIRAVGNLRLKELKLEISSPAVVAMAHGLVLITENHKHFPMPELQVLKLSDIDNR